MRSINEVRSRYCGTAGKPGGKPRIQTSTYPPETPNYSPEEHVYSALKCVENATRPSFNEIFRQINAKHQRRVNVGLELRIETYDPQRVSLEHELRKLPEFLSIENNGKLNLTIDGKEIAVTVRVDDDFVYVVQHVSCRETDAILGLLIRKILMLNDHVLVSGFES